MHVGSGFDAQLAHADPFMACMLCADIVACIPVALAASAIAVQSYDV